MNYAGVDVVFTVLIFTVHNFRETRLQHYHEIHIFPFPTYHFHKYETPMAQGTMGCPHIKIYGTSLKIVFKEPT